MKSKSPLVNKNTQISELTEENMDNEEWQDKRYQKLLIQDQLAKSHSDGLKGKPHDSDGEV